jgi:uncharacterized protein YeaO (DUF488 family)
VRHPPRGVPKVRLASGNWYDVWLPGLAPSAALVKAGRDQTGEPGWRQFERRYRAEMKRPESRHLLDLLATLSRRTDFSVGCYCESETRCHRSILRVLLREHGAVVVEE